MFLANKVSLSHCLLATGSEWSTGPSADESGRDAVGDAERTQLQSTSRQFTVGAVRWNGIQ